MNVHVLLLNLNIEHFVIVSLSSDGWAVSLIYICPRVYNRTIKASAAVV